jgi:hypothetical protein
VTSTFALEKCRSILQKPTFDSGSASKKSIRSFRSFFIRQDTATILARSDAIRIGVRSVIRT